VNGGKRQAISRHIGAAAISSDKRRTAAIVAMSQSQFAFSEID